MKPIDNPLKIFLYGRMSGVPSKSFAYKVVSICLGLAILLTGMGVGAFLARGINVSWKSQIDISYADLVAIILSALSVILTVLAIFLAVFGVIGWASFSERLRDSTYTYLRGQLSEGQPLHSMIRKEVREAVYEGVLPVEEAAFEPPLEDEPFDGAR